ncbi:MAG: hypothetical protein ABSF44_03810 [Candidatus Bathyarchaeia archaeon]|jgi:hypothetical protein
MSGKQGNLYERTKQESYEDSTLARVVNIDAITNILDDARSEFPRQTIYAVSAAWDAAVELWFKKWFGTFMDFQASEQT